MTNTQTYFAYWGKAMPASEGGAQYHLLPFHSLDVAAVGVAYLHRSEALLQAFCDMLVCERDDFLAWAAFLLAVHDLGKFSEAFQSQRSDLIRDLQQRPENPAMQYSERHDSLGYWLWRDQIGADVAAALDLDCSHDGQESLACWVRAVTGHHGTPPKSGGVVGRFFRQEDMRLAAEFAVDAGRLLLTPGARTIGRNMDRKTFRRASEMLSWWFAGVTVLADWLGSNTHFFPYVAQPLALRQYWDGSAERANGALDTAGVLPARVRAGQMLRDFFPYIETASPLQRWAGSVEIGSQPTIVLLEDVTGAGKTEAAMMLTYRLMAAGQSNGFFIGLPTMATANAMYKRVAGVYRQLFEGDADLALAHGHRRLVDEFARSVLPAADDEHDRAQLDDTASARCSAWLADMSKRALLASAGVGTIDQALLAVLHSKHQSLRLLGLFRKVLIVDEVHACDAYMLSVLERLLEFHARADGSVILLSATLPIHMKQSLLNAYAMGRQQASVKPIASQAYPLATRWSDVLPAPLEDALGSRANVARTVAVHYEADQAAAYAYVLAALAEGKCVGWIRNTVADAMTAYAHIVEFVPREKITLFHARFALCDRLRKEEQVLACFGEESGQAARAGRLMIATQVAEQSLDIDFDVLVTDLAPIDRVLQRAGRLHRHVRDGAGNRVREPGAVDARPPPCLWVFGPAWSMEPGARWYADAFDKGQYVYPHHGQLWLTAQLLQRGQFNMPAEARSMIEAVFSIDAAIPPALSSIAIKAEGREIADASQAQRNVLEVDTGYVRGGQNDWWSEAQTPSRLGEETSEIMLAKWVGGQLLRWDPGVWSYSMVKIAARLMATEVDQPDAGSRAVFARLKQTLPNQGKWSFMLALAQEADGTWQADAWTAGGGRGAAKPELVRWIYDADFGLRTKESDAAFAAAGSGVTG